jgi:hypothetical protein
MEQVSCGCAHARLRYLAQESFRRTRTRGDRGRSRSILLVPTIRIGPSNALRMCAVAETTALVTWRVLYGRLHLHLVEENQNLKASGGLCSRPETSPLICNTRHQYSPTRSASLDNSVALLQLSLSELQRYSQPLPSHSLTRHCYTSSIPTAHSLRLSKRVPVSRFSMFAQQTTTGRPAPGLASGRLQNGKLS